MAKSYQTLVHTKGSFLLHDKPNLRIGKAVSFLLDKWGKCLFLDRHQLRRFRHSMREGESNGNYKVLRVAISNR